MNEPQNPPPDHEQAVASQETLEARAFLRQAVTRIHELSDIEHARLRYLEQRTHDHQEIAEDLFHSANNALFIMSVNLDLLTRYLRASGELEKGPVRRWLALLVDKSQTIAAINRQLLKAGEAGMTGALYLVHSFISFRVAIQRAVDVYSDVAHEKNITINWAIPDYAAIAIWSDGVAIGSVLDNLLSNAIKFSKPGTSIDVTMQREGEELVCAVRDHGPGMSEADVARAFERGARRGPKPTGGETSSGYGLAIAKGIVDSLGGRIWCECEQGAGCCFFFSLPTAPPAPALQAPGSA
jgi:signal transduction histidine kinase